MIAFGLDLRAALGLNARKFELFREDLRELIHGEIHFENVAAGSIAGLAAAVFIHVAGSQRLAGFTFTLSDAAGVTAAEAEVRHFNLRYRDADKVLSLFADQLALRDVLLQVLFDAAPDNLPKAKIILFYVENHNYEVGWWIANGGCFLTSTICNPPSNISSLLLCVSASKNAGNVVQHVRRTHIAVGVILDQPALHHVDLFLRFFVDH